MFRDRFYGACKTPRIRLKLDESTETQNGSFGRWNRFAMQWTFTITGAGKILVDQWELSDSQENVAGTIATKCCRTAPLGLGYANLGARLLMSDGAAYDSGRAGYATLGAGGESTAFMLRRGLMAQSGAPFRLSAWGSLFLQVIAA